MSNKTLIVEFIGLPGVGKSTLSHHIAEEMRNDHKSVSELSNYHSHHRSRFSQALRVRALALKTLFLKPRHSYASIRTIGQSKQQSFSETKNMGLSWLYNSELTRQLGRTCGVHILDQGLIQAVWSVAMRAKSQSWIDLMDLLKVNYNCRVLVVWVTAGIPTVLARIHGREREQSRFDGMSENLMRSVMERGSSVFDQIMSEFDELVIQDQKFSRIRIDNDGDDMAEQTQKLIDVINEIFVTVNS